MDQSLKARLIGATVLVILAVVLIPELLSGRKAATTSGQETATNERRTFTIDIGKSGDAMTAPESARPQPLPPPVEASGPATPAPDRGPGAVAREAMDTQVPRADPGAVEQRGRVAAPPDSAPAAAEGPTKGSAAAATAAPPAATQPPTAPGAAGRGGYFIQVGAFSSAESARKLMAQLEADGYSVRVAPITRGGKTLHRVRVGPADSRAAAQQLADRLKARGLPAALVPSE